MRKFYFQIAERQLMTRKGIVQTLTSYNLAEKIWEAENGVEAVNICLKNPIDLAIIDFSLPLLNGFEVSKKILSKKKNIKIIAFTEYDELPVVLNFLKIDVKGFLTKTVTEQELVDTIRTVMSGDYYYHSYFDVRINKWLKEGLPKNIPTLHLSKREIQLITLLSRGKTSSQIAQTFGISPRTVETYRYDLIKKTQSNNASGLVGYAYRNGLV